MNIFTFNKNTDISNWRVIDDHVMGGVSNGNIKLNTEGNGEYFGHISLENNGGFSSVRYLTETTEEVKNYSKIVLKLKGDGRNYQFRIKENKTDDHSYIYSFTTNKEWEVIEVPLKEMHPAFRGRKLEIPNFCANTISEIAFLIANKKEEDFNLEIDSINLI